MTGIDVGRGQLQRLVHQLRSDGGSALIEFAVALPIMATMLVAGTGTVMLIQARFVVHSAAMEAATIGANMGTSIDPYNTAVDAARAGAERTMLDHGLDPSRATITFDGTSPVLDRGTLFQVQVSYAISLALPMARYLGGGSGGAGDFSVRSVAVVPIQQYKARWPCPSPDPICN